MDPCQTCKPLHDKQTHKTFLRAADGKCLHYYFYLIDEDFGLGYVRVPTWLAVQLARQGTSFTLMGNVFSGISDFSHAQELSDSLKVDLLHHRLDLFAERFCPIIKRFDLSYHWSIMQAEYATDIVFEHQEDLQLIYGHLTRTAIHTVKPENIAIFLGRKLHENYQNEMGNNFNTRIEGTRIKHTMGSVSMVKELGKISKTVSNK